jgi:DNA-binding transcriptional LysR family regulator
MKPGKRMVNTRTLDHVRAVTILAKVVECGSFRGGAEALGLSPSVASHHISTLEAELGAALLYRSTRRQALTPAGERLLASIAPLVSSTELLLDEIALESGAQVGPIRVTMPTPVALGPVLPLIWAFVAQSKAIELSVHIADGREDLLSEGFDLAIRMGRHDPGSLQSRFLQVAECALVASPDLVAAMPPATAPADLSDWRWVHHTARLRTIELTHAKHGAEQVTAKRVVSANAALAVLQLAIAGAGVAALPLTVAGDALASGALVRVLPAWHLPLPDVAAFWPANTPPTASVSRLVDFLSEQLGESTRTLGIAVAAE